MRALALGRERAVRLRDGSLVHVRDDEYVGRAVCFFGDLDPKISWVLRALLRPGDLFVDVGANYGVVTMQAARLVGPTGAVHAVEPQPSMASRLRRSIADNGYSNVTVHEVALSGDDGRLDMFVPAVNTGAASLTRRWNTDGTTVAVEVRAAGPFLEGISAGTTPRLVKLDVEGHEASVINAAREFLVASGVMVLFESNDDVIPFWDDETTIALLDMGYTLYALPLRNLFRPSLRRIRPGDEVHAHDFLARMDPV